MSLNVLSRPALCSKVCSQPVDNISKNFVSHGPNKTPFFHKITIITKRLTLKKL